jgi:hypothetical protein
MTKRFEIANLIAIRRGIDHHNAECPVKIDAILLNPYDYGLLNHPRLWGLLVVPDPTVKVKRFRLKCDASPEEIEHELEAYLNEL